MQYVIVFPKVANSQPGERVLLVKKDRPAWQHGRFNLVGGKIEEGETPEQAALRELKEEAGLVPMEVNRVVPDEKNPKKNVTVSVPLEPTVMGQILGSWGVVYCVKVPILFGQTIKPREGETEEVAWHDWRTVKSDRRLLPNLKIVIPMMAMGVHDWVIADEGPEISIDGRVSEIGKMMITI